MAELSPLCRRMIKDMTIRNLSAATQNLMCITFISSASSVGDSPIDWARRMFVLISCR